jgi:hypothetical protein
VFTENLAEGAEVNLNIIRAEKPKLVNGIPMIVCNENGQIEAGK